MPIVRDRWIGLHIDACRVLAHQTDFVLLYQIRRMVYQEPPFETKPILLLKYRKLKTSLYFRYNLPGINTQMLNNTYFSRMLVKFRVKPT